MMRKSLIIRKKIVLFLLVCFVTVFFSACKQYTDDIKEYFEYWTTEAGVHNHDIKADNYKDNTGIDCISSNSNKEIILNVRSPKDYKFKMPDAEPKTVKFLLETTPPLPPQIL